MDFFVYSRAAPGAADVEHGPSLNEAHWSYMDRFADGMTARGPTLALDRETWTGSLHIVDLPSAEAAREFAEREPYNRAGLFAHHTILRFRNLLGRTMWEFQGGADEPRFLVIARLPTGEPRPAAAVPGYAALPRERLIVHGELSTPDDGSPAGVVLAIQAPSRDAAQALLEGGRAELDPRLDVEILDWQFGGRR